MAKTGRKRRERGTGTLFKRHGIFYFKHVVNGKTKKMSTGCTKKLDAEVWVKKYLDPVKDAKTKEEIAFHIAEARRLRTHKPIPLTEVWKSFMKKFTRSVAPGTLDNYERHWLKFKTWLESNHPEVKNLNDVNSEFAEEYADKLSTDDKLSASTFNQHRGTLMQIHKSLAKELATTENIWVHIERKTDSGVSRKELDEKQITAVLGKFDDEKFELLNKDEMRVMFNCGAWTGLRLADCSLMKWVSIDIDENLIRCVPIKTQRRGKTVTIPLHPTLKQQLLIAKGWKTNDYVLPKVAERYKRNPHGVKMDALKVFQKCKIKTSIEVPGRKKQANIVGFHSLRHSFVSFCAKAGVPLAVVQTIVGHTSPAITRHYTHIGTEAVKLAVKALPGGDPEQLPSPEKRVTKALELLKEKKRKTDTEKHIVKILEGDFSE